MWASPLDLMTQGRQATVIFSRFCAICAPFCVNMCNLRFFATHASGVGMARDMDHIVACAAVRDQSGDSYATCTTKTGCLE